MLVSKNPYVTEPRQNLSPKKPHFTLKTGEKSTQNLLLKTLIFIVEKYGKEVIIVQKSAIISFAIRSGESKRCLSQCVLGTFRPKHS